MDAPLALIGLIGLSVVILVAIWQNLRKKPPDYPYVRQDALFTPAEQVFFRVLDQALEPHWLIFGKVRLADIIKTQDGLDRSRQRGAFNKICAKHLDFVLCRADTLTVIGVIELDDRSHERPDRKARDHFVDQALLAAGVPILHVPVTRTYNISALRKQLHQTFKT